MSWLVDTNVLSELLRPRPNARVLDWFESIDQASVSVITVEEIEFGFAWKPRPPVMRTFVAGLLERCSILPVTRGIAERAGLMRGELQAEGSTRTPADMLIAATAQVHALTLVTRNLRDFKGCRIPLFNPFE
ncbi:MAG TPA: type II toxin-antitoxin system VapC family toxin [Thermoanaerobaculia bacterium]|nr:type II toxin-antitoxin system VapC family toxin [Thermoanaerobaculia bacterium]